MAKQEGFHRVVRNDSILCSQATFTSPPSRHSTIDRRFDGLPRPGPSGFKQEFEAIRRGHQQPGDPVFGSSILESHGGSFQDTQRPVCALEDVVCSLYRSFVSCVGEYIALSCIAYLTFHSSGCSDHRTWPEGAWSRHEAESCTNRRQSRFTYRLERLCALPL